MHDDITVSVVIFGTAGAVYPFTSTSSQDSVAAASPVGGGGGGGGRALNRWKEIKKSVDLIKMMHGKQGVGSSKWHSLIDELKAMDQ